MLQAFEKYDNSMFDDIKEIVMIFSWIYMNCFRTRLLVFIRVVLENIFDRSHRS